MSHYSGFSSASRVEIERLNQINEEMASRNAAEMAPQKAQLDTQEARLATMQALLVANGLFQSVNEPLQGTSAQALAQDRVQAQTQARALPVFRPSQTFPASQQITSNAANSLNPSRKRHSSQQLERAAKIAVGITHDRYEFLSQANSNPDKTMKPGSVASTPRAQILTSATTSGSNMVNNQRPRPQDAPLNNQIKGDFALNNDKAMGKKLRSRLN
jgi:hypothetical protein